MRLYHTGSSPSPSAITITQSGSDSEGSGNGSSSGTPRECYEGSIRTNFKYDIGELLISLEGTFEVCVNGQYGSVCDIGWDEQDALAICRSEIGSNVGKHQLHV